MTQDRSQTPLELGNPFWDFACRVYAEPAIAETCLDLQEEFAVNVNLLLFSAWCGSRGTRLERPALESLATLIAPWTEGVVANLRRARRAWKELGERHPAVQSGRDALKKTELLAEQIASAMLYRAVAAGSGLGAEAVPIDRNHLAANVGLALELAGVGAARRAEVAARLARAGIAVAY